MKPILDGVLYGRVDDVEAAITFVLAPPDHAALETSPSTESWWDLVGEVRALEPEVLAEWQRVVAELRGLRIVSDALSRDYRGGVDGVEFRGGRLRWYTLPYRGNQGGGASYQDLGVFLRGGPKSWAGVGHAQRAEIDRAVRARLLQDAPTFCQRCLEVGWPV